MAKQFSYTVQAVATAFEALPVTGTELHQNWNVFHKNPNDVGLWNVLNDELQITTNQSGLSGRYNAKHLNLTDYKIRTEIIPSPVDDDSFGVHFRYQDNFHFYFIAWDGGGEYNWSTATVRLYKVEGDNYKLLAHTDKLGHWTGGQSYEFEIELIGNRIIAFIDGQRVFDFIDNKSPYLYGAYGPCATSQVTTWKNMTDIRNHEFVVSANFASDVSIDNFSYEKSKAISNVPVGPLMSQALQAYKAQNRITVETPVKKYSVVSNDMAVEVFFNPTAPSYESVDGLEYVYGYLKYEDRPPLGPQSMSATPGVFGVTWKWVDSYPFKDGYEILDENDNVIAVVSASDREWYEGNLLPDTTYTRKVRAYNRFGNGPVLSSTTTTESLAIVKTPDPPNDLRATVNSETEITWYWDPVRDAESYELYAEDGTFIISTTSTKYKEQGLTPDTQYTRYVVAVNIAGKSSPSQVATAITDAAAPVGPIPNPPLNLTGMVVGSTSIEWSWDPPQITVPTEIDLGGGVMLQLTQEQMDAQLELELSQIKYRVYDANGQVLYETESGVTQWIESGLLPDTSYTHYVTAFNYLGESLRSNYAFARTMASDNYVVPEEPPEWPIDVECRLPETEPVEKITAFHTGVGDNLDLKVRKNKDGAASELFGYEVQLKAIADREIEYYPKQTFRFRFHGEGIEKDWGVGSSKGSAISGSGGNFGQTGATPQWGVSGAGGSGTSGTIGSSGASGGSVNTQIGTGSGYSHPISGYPADGLPPGYELISGIGKYEMELAVSPRKYYSYTICGKVNEPEWFSYQIELEGIVQNRIEQALPFMYRAKLQLIFSADNYLPVTTASLFSGPTATVWGPNRWVYDPSTDIVKGTLNTNMSGMYDRGYVNLEDFELECEIGASQDWDDDFIGVAFRINTEGIGSGSIPTLYYFGADKIDARSLGGGTGIGGWSLMKRDITPEQGVQLIQAHLNSHIVASSSLDGWEYDTWYKVKIRAVGNRITIWLDGVLAIDYTDTTNNPRFLKGAFGPVNLSQESAQFRNFKIKQLAKRSLYTDWNSTSIKDTNTVGNEVNLLFADPNNLTSLKTAYELLNPLVPAEEANFQASIAPNTGGLIDSYYEIEDTSADIITSIDTTGKVAARAWTANVLPAIVRIPFSLTSPSLLHSLTDAHFDLATARELTQTIGGVSKPYTATEVMREVIADYAARNGISVGSIEVSKASVKTPNSNVTLLTDIDGNSPIRAFTSSSTTFSACEVTDGHAYEYEGWIPQNRTHHLLELKNRHGVIYRGDIANVEYTLTNNRPSDTAIEIEWIGNPNSRISTHTDSVQVRSLAKTVQRITGQVDGEPKYFFAGDLITIPNLPEYKDAYYSVSTSGGDDNVYAWFMDPIAGSTGNTSGTPGTGSTGGYGSVVSSSTYDGVISAQNMNSIIVIDAVPRYTPKTWVGYGDWIVVNVNGDGPFLQDGDGYLEAKIPVNMMEGSNINISKWSVEVDNNSNIDVRFENGVGGHTTVKGDNVIFSSQVTDKMKVKSEMFGAKISGDTVYEIKDNQPMRIQGRFINPFRDAKLQNIQANIYKFVVTSTNPNVDVKTVNQHNINWGDRSSLYLDMEIEARILNMSQTAWNPLVHNGYYYFNQKENFLYAEANVLGELELQNSFTDVEFPYIIKVFCERKVGAGMRYDLDTNLVDFIGAPNNVSLLSNPGNIELDRASNGELYNLGTYTSENKQLGGIPEAWGEVRWNATTPDGSKVKMEVSVYDNGQWQPYVEVQNGQVNPEPLAQQLRYRATLTSGNKKLNHRVWSQNVSGRNAFLKGTFNRTELLYSDVKLITNNVSGEWISDTFDMNGNKDDMGDITFLVKNSGGTGEAYEVFTMSSDNLLGPWDGTGEPWVPLNNLKRNLDGTLTGSSVSANKRYVRFKAVLTRGERDSVLTKVLTSSGDFSKGTIDNIAISDSSFMLADVSANGYWISDAIDFTNVKSFEGISLLTSTLANNGMAVKVSTVSATTLATMAQNEQDPAQWYPLSAAGLIQSPAARYLKVKVELTPGMDAAVGKTITHNTLDDFTNGSFGYNVDSSTGELRLTDASMTGYFDSVPMSVGNIEGWDAIEFVATMLQDKVTVYTSTASSAFGPWTQWEPLSAQNIIQSPIDTYIRYRLEINNEYVEGLQDWEDNTAGLFEVGATVGNVEFLPSHTGFKQQNPSQRLTYISPIKNVRGVMTFNEMDFVQNLATGASAQIMTRSSFDGTTWTNWEALGANNEILSTPQQYFQYRVDITEGYGSAVTKEFKHSDKATFEGAQHYAENAVAEDTGIRLIDPSLDGEFYSETQDFFGRVSGLSDIDLKVTLPDLGGSVKIYTVSSDNEGDVSGNDISVMKTLGWKEATYDAQSGQYVPQSTPYRFIGYKLEIEKGYNAQNDGTYIEDAGSAWTGASTNIDVQANQLILTVASQDGEYESNAISMMDLYDKWEGYKSLDFSYTADFGGSVELLVRYAPTEADLATQPYTSLGTAGPFTLAPNEATPFMQYQLLFTPGVEDLGNGNFNYHSPSLTSVQVVSLKRDFDTPVVTEITFGSAADAVEVYESSSMEDFSFSYEGRVYRSPIITEVNVNYRANVFSSPIIDELYASASIIEYTSPLLESASWSTKLFDVEKVSPILHQVELGAKMSDQVIPEEYELSMVGIVKSDQAKHPVTTDLINTLVTRHFMATGVDETDLVRKRYSLVSGAQGIYLETGNNNNAIYYENGNSVVYAYTTAAAQEAVYSQVKIKVDANNEAVVTPIPQQGAPLVVKDASGVEKKEVAFYDKFGEVSLDYVHEWEATGERDTTIEHPDYDPSTFHIFVDEDHDTLYTEISTDDYIICGNRITFKETYPKGTPLKVTYRLKNSYAVDYNHDTGRNYAKIKLHNPELINGDSISVRYETSAETAYYVAEEVNMNPMHSLLNEGFIYITDDVYPAKKLEVYYNPNVLRADGYDKTTIIAVAKDMYGNPVVGDRISFFVGNGELEVKQGVTDINGMAIAVYTANKYPQDVDLTVVDTTARIETRKVISLKSSNGRARLSLDVNKTVIDPTGLDSVHVTARLVDENQESASGVGILFSVSDGKLSNSQAITSITGEALTTLTTSTSPTDNLIRVEAYVPTLNIREHINIRVSEVVSFV